MVRWSDDRRSAQIRNRALIAWLWPRRFCKCATQVRNRSRGLRRRVHERSTEHGPRSARKPHARVCVAAFAIESGSQRRGGSCLGLLETLDEPLHIRILGILPLRRPRHLQGFLRAAGGAQGEGQIQLNARMTRRHE